MIIIKLCDLCTKLCTTCIHLMTDYPTAENVFFITGLLAVEQAVLLLQIDDMLVSSASSSNEECSLYKDFV